MGHNQKNELEEFTADIEQDVKNIQDHLAKVDIDHSFINKIFYYTKQLKTHSTDSPDKKKFQQTLIELFEHIYIYSMTPSILQIIADNSLQTIAIVLPTILTKIIQKISELDLPMMHIYLNQLKKRKEHLEKTADEQSTSSIQKVFSKIFMSKKDNSSNKKTPQILIFLSSLIKIFEDELNKKIALTLNEIQKRIKSEFPQQMTQHQQQLVDYKKAINFLFDGSAPSSQSTVNIFMNIEIETNVSPLRFPELPPPPIDLPNWARAYLALCNNQLEIDCHVARLHECIELIILYENHFINSVSTLLFQDQTVPLFNKRNEELLEDIVQLLEENPHVLIIDQIYADIRNRVNTSFPKKEDYPLSIKGPLGITYQYNRNFFSENEDPVLYMQVNQFLIQKLSELTIIIAENQKHPDKLLTPSLAPLNNNVENEYSSQEQPKASDILIKLQRTIKSPHLKAPQDNPHGCDNNTLPSIQKFGK